MTAPLPLPLAEPGGGFKGSVQPQACRICRKIFTTQIRGVRICGRCRKALKAREAKKPSRSV